MGEWEVLAYVAPYLLAALLWRWLAEQHRREVERLKRENLRAEVARLAERLKRENANLRAEVARLEVTRG